jgi:hypothetical protein
MKCFCGKFTSKIPFHHKGKCIKRQLTDKELHKLVRAIKVMELEKY